MTMAVPPQTPPTQKEDEEQHAPKPKVKEYPSEALATLPEKVNVEVSEGIQKIPPRPVPVKVTIPVSSSVAPIPPRPVPVKVRVNDPGPAPVPVCLELLMRLGELQSAQEDAAAILTAFC